MVPILINLITKENSKSADDDDASPLKSIFSLGNKDAGNIGGIVKGLFN